MDLKLTAEWLQAKVAYYDYKPSGLMTPRDRAELERRKAAQLSAAFSAAPSTDKAGDADKPAAVSAES